MPLDATEQELMQIITERSDDFEENLRHLVEISSFTDDAEGVGRMVRACKSNLGAAGFELREERTDPAGPHLFAHVGRLNSGPQLLLLGHTDTVYPSGHAVGSFRRDPADSDRWRGPGVTDMKGGLVVMMAAAQLLVEKELLGDGGLSIFLCADEETGAPTGKPWLLNAAKGKDLCLVFETGSRLGPRRSSFVTERKGSARFRIEIKGRESHAGAKKEKGLSAAEEAAHKIIALEALNDFAKGTTVNVGLVKAGSAANTVPGFAELEIDCRYRTAEAGVAVEAAIREIAIRGHIENVAEDLRPQCDIQRHSRCLPLLPTTESRKQAAKIVACGADLGMELVEEYRGGASDGNTTAAAGCPTVDGLGTVGAKIHSEAEWVEVNSLVERTSLLVLFAKRFFEGAQL